MVIFAVIAENVHEELDDVLIHEKVDLLCIPAVSYVGEDIVDLILDLPFKPPQRLHEVIDTFAVNDQVDLISIAS